MNNDKIKIIFMGTPDFSVPTLDMLCRDKDLDVMFTITKVDKENTRGHNIVFSEVKQYSIEHNIKCYQPIKIREDRELIDIMKKSAPDFIIVVAFGQILSKEILDIPKFACINGHASLLPKYRGASPIQSMILNGDEIAGTTTMLMAEALDSGDILEQTSFRLNMTETGESLFNDLSIKTAELILHTVKNFKNINPVKQNDNAATYVKTIKKEDGYIDLDNESAIDIERKMRAYDPWPSAYIKLDDKLLKLFKAELIDKIDGKILKEIQKNVFISDENLYLKTKDQYLRVLELQPESKRRMKTIDYLNGFKLN